MATSVTKYAAQTDEDPENERDRDGPLRSQFVRDNAEHQRTEDRTALDDREEDNDVCIAHVQRFLGKDRREDDDRQDAVIIDEERHQEARDGWIFFLDEERPERLGSPAHPRPDQRRRAVPRSERGLVHKQEQRKGKDEEERRGDDKRHPNIVKIVRAR